MTVIVYEDNALIADRCLVTYMAGVATFEYAKKIHLSSNKDFAVASTGDEASISGLRAIMHQVEIMLKLIYSMEDREEFPAMKDMVKILDGRQLLVMTRDRIFHVRQAALEDQVQKKKGGAITELNPWGMRALGNCAPFYIVERKLNTSKEEAIKRAVLWKMGKETEVDFVYQNSLEPFPHAVPTDAFAEDEVQS